MYGTIKINFVAAVIFSKMEAGGQNNQEEQGFQRNTSNGVAQDDCKEETPERKITQTDHINKRLLDSFLTRMNQPNSGIPSVDRINCDDSHESHDSQEPVLREDFEEATEQPVGH